MYRSAVFIVYIPIACACFNVKCKRTLKVLFRGLLIDCRDCAFNLIDYMRALITTVLSFGRTKVYAKPVTTKLLKIYRDISYLCNMGITKPGNPNLG